MANAKSTSKNSNWLAGALTLTEQTTSPIVADEMGFVRVGDVIYGVNAAGGLVPLVGTSGAPSFTAITKTAVALPASTYANGTDGVGATLTANANGVGGAIGGVTPGINTIVLVTEQASTFQNGLYTVTALGSASTPRVLTRLSGFDTASTIVDGAIVVVQTGTFAGRLYEQTATVATVGTDAVTFEQPSNVMLLDGTQTNTGPKTFTAAGVAKINNAGDTFATTLASAATAARTATFPDASVTLASAGVATGAPSGTAAITPVAVTPLFTGTGCSAAGQVITTTDNQTMTLNQCAGMMFVSDGTPGNFAVILSNTAVTGAPAVLTVAGFAQTAAGAYSIFNGVSVATTVHTHTQA